MTVSVSSLNRLLPQTQCRECGYEGCLPYAQALSDGSAAHNLCAPGGETVMLDLAALLGRNPLAPAKIQKSALAWIDESACIGCTACIRACPVDAIAGASKLMHTVIADECTGCGLCVAPCPVDCIHMRPFEGTLPQARTLSRSTRPRFAAAEHAQTRYERRNERKTREAAERRAQLAQREAAAKAKTAAPSQTAAASPADLIAKAMMAAQAQQNRRTASSNRNAFQEQQLEAARQRAAYRRAQRDLRYGSEAEKTAAIEFLRRHKAEQEAQNGSAAP